MQRCRHERADRRENNCGIELFRWHFIRTTGPSCAEFSRRFLASFIVRPRERENFAAFEMSDLRDDVGRGAKPVNAQSLRVARFPERAVAD